MTTLSERDANGRSMLRGDGKATPKGNLHDQAARLDGVLAGEASPKEASDLV
eukprot:CAMPEP_0180671926 /NCGR_PEP_ID=MMETSP1037_2-20121125/64850_1 /TAXON_ID=632150 /ORGANISM="Azadinium spinosum, Strain 3D9" /LENGTH=51 /DNA_ID=CAMNT_0022701017 /DNA_START=62 /DNA_END=218 /DNA_ORIENTATION=-